MQAPARSSLETALELSSNLIPIRPLRPGLKKPWAGADGKALTLSKWQDVETFYKEHPTFGVGACCAPIDHSPIVVVDIDICDVLPEERPKVWTHLTSLGVSTKDHVWIQRTGRDNWQVFYWALELGDHIPRRQIDANHTHIDLIANGYVVTAPSNTKDEPPKHPGQKGGGPYRWLEGKSPWDYPLSSVSPPPEALMAWWREVAAMAPDTTMPDLRGLATDDSGTGPPITSKRNVTLTSIAGALAVRLGPLEMAARLHGINRARCVPPLPDREVETIIRSINGREDGGRSRNLGASSDELHMLG